jgi:AbrB family looped-hinge helix DNA binding protein
MQTTFVDNAKVMSKGQVTIPKDVRKVLGVSEGDRISFVVEGDTVRIVNAAVFAMQMLQSNLQGEAKKSRLESEDDIMQLVKDIRDESNNDSSD